MSHLTAISAPSPDDDPNQPPKPADVPGGLPSQTPPSADTPVPIDEFDPARLRLSQDYASSGLRRVVMTVPCRKPDRSWFSRVDAREAYQLDIGVIDLKEEREIYLVDPTLVPELAVEPTFGRRRIVTAINRQGVLYLWPLKLPGPDGKLDEWSRSALEAAELARTRWVRVTANMSLGAYEVVEALGNLPEPTWPTVTLGELLRVAFRDRLIQSLDHPVLRKLRGEL